MKNIKFLKCLYIAAFFPLIGGVNARPSIAIGEGDLKRQRPYTPARAVGREDLGAINERDLKRRRTYSPARTAGPEDLGAINERDLKRRRTYSPARTAGPADPEVNYVEGIAQIKAGRLFQAIECFKRAASVYEGCVKSESVLDTIDFLGRDLLQDLLQKDPAEALQLLGIVGVPAELVCMATQDEPLGDVVPDEMLWVEAQDEPLGDGVEDESPWEL